MSLLRILLGSLLSVAVAGCSAGLSPSPVDVDRTAILFHNLTGYTWSADDRLQTFSALLVDGGRIVATGDGELMGRGSTRVDLGGRVVLPGLIDAHGHVLSLGESRIDIDLRGTTSADAAARAIADFAARHPGREWLRGRGWNQVLWSGKRFPTAAQIDRYVADRPVWVRRVDGHAAWGNSRVLALAGIDADTADPDGGEIVRDASGQPTGVFIDNAMALVERHMPQRPRAEKREALLDAMHYLATLGITSAHDAGVDFETYELYRELSAAGAMPIRIDAMISATDPQLDRMLAAGPIYAERLRIASVKFYADGALGSRGAALIEPYADRPGERGLVLTPQPELRKLFASSVAAGFQLCVHAIGDYGNRLALDEIAHVQDTSGRRDLRHRIEHAQVIAVEDIPRFRSLGVIPSMQPVHATSDMNMAQDRIGATRLAGAYAWRTLIDQGSRIAAGSDFPVELANPFHGLHAAVTRQDHSNRPAGGWIPEQAMTRAEALRSFTADAAYAAHQDDTVGTLEPGKWADFIVVDQDLFTIPAAAIWRTRAVETRVAGEAVRK